MSSEDRSPSKFVPGEEFIQLFTQAQRPLYLSILSQLGHAQAAEEVLQETNLIIWSKALQFQPGSNFLAWGRQIAQFEVLKWKQRRSRERLTFSDKFINAVADGSASRSEELELRQRALEECLKKLPDQDRELIETRYRPGMNGKDVAEFLGRPANSVYQSLGRIRKALIDCVNRTLAAETAP